MLCTHAVLPAHVWPSSSTLIDSTVKPLAHCIYIRTSECCCLVGSLAGKLACDAPGESLSKTSQLWRMAPGPRRVSCKRRWTSSRQTSFLLASVKVWLCPLGEANMFCVLNEAFVGYFWPILWQSPGATWPWEWSLAVLSGYNWWACSEAAQVWVTANAMDTHICLLSDALPREYVLLTAWMPSIRCLYHAVHQRHQCNA